MHDATLFNTRSKISPAVNRQTNSTLVQNLQQQIRNLETSSRSQRAEVISTGSTGLDQILPEGGLTRGTIIEWFADGPGSGAATLSLVASRQACLQSSESNSEIESSEMKNQQTGTLVVVDRHQMFYPPAAAAWGIDLSNTIVLRPKNPADQNWAMQQALSCPAVAVVWGMVSQIDERAFRRLQLAAEESGSIGLFHRPANTRGLPSWAEIQLAIKSHPSDPRQTLYRSRRLEVELIRCRGGTNGKRVYLEVNETNGMVNSILNGSKLSSANSSRHTPYVVIPKQVLDSA